MNHKRSFAFSLVLLAAIAFLGAFAWQEGWVTPPAMAHAVEGQEQCLMCHNPEGGMKPAPEAHKGMPVDVCLWCHATDAAVQTTAPPAMPHAVEGQESCSMCHTDGGVKPPPADHEGRDNQYCTLCHSPA
jgi:predicted CXXCH cytochrome family protein